MLTTNTNINNTETEMKNNIQDPTKILGFLKSFALIILNILLAFVFGSLIIYSCKVAQSNILPTDMNCYPYTNYIPNIKEIDINININNVHDTLLSNKIRFPYDTKSFPNSILNFLLKRKMSPSANGVENYFISILDSIIAFDFKAYNSYYGFLNEIPEIVTLIFGPIITLLFTTILSLINLGYLSLLWFTNLTWFFKKNENYSGEGEPKWESISILEPINYLVSIALVILFFCLFWVGFFTIIPLVSSMTILLCFISYFTVSAVDSEKVKYNVLSCIKDNIKYRKKGIMILLSLTCIFLTFVHLGTGFGLISLLTILLLYFNIIPLSLFKSNTPVNLTEIVSFKEAYKKCSNNKINSSNSSSNSNNFGNPISKIIGGLENSVSNLLPRVKWQSLELPDSIPIPEIKMHNVKLPKVNIPKEIDIKIPQINIPNIELPKAISNNVIESQDKLISNLKGLDKALSK